MNAKLSIVALVALMALAASAASALQLEKACTHVSKTFLSPDSCKRCCVGEGYNDSYFLSGRCQCLGASQERQQQEAALKASTTEHVCSHMSGPSHEEVEGVPREIACDRCCRDHSFRTSTFNIDHHFRAGVGASVRGTGATGPRSECICEGLTLNFVAAQ